MTAVTLRTHQQETCDALEFELDRLDRTPPAKRFARLHRIDLLGIDLWQMCRDLEAALDSEDVRLTSEGTTDALDDRWIKNLHRLEIMRALLDRAAAVMPGLKGRAA